ncbi:DUF1015 family protein [Tetragenococcus koreensis]|uniref:DUF1015 domain-containing protein n=1 Tax=Tetragenococcus koreensis TaxID=290335 RepID=A0AAN4UDC2_9ENTE|nr:DUF1015 family protein [Tetragenococcus koreensis]MCF1584786.1 DUF1015 family protein [Tetragenococcus koreensis]MCF1614548.1 DUF1015 family protein [Tetragenococcus koreensis]MCF1619933.1 DUF1015 family protein [Tetragenococcus koreensis]MCF1624180.1 DUF1015 family protein [Tetragenococcus koreensis]MCF1627352.1 DUF1015 family protein [Tetragenococcus koreensis]
MVVVRPFKAIRPEATLADKVAELPYDVVDSAEARALAQDNPYSYFHIDKAEIDLPQSISPYDEAVYQKAAANLADFLQKGWLEKDGQENYYLYQLTMDGRSQTGLVACTSIDDYAEGKIKKHEYTRHEKEIDRMNHIRSCDANTSPIFLSYRENQTTQQLIRNWQDTHEAIYDFTSYHNVHHKVWVLDDTAVIKQLEEAFSSLDALYIADGHHRTESAVKVGLEKRQEQTNSAESDSFLSILFPEDELLIKEYNRVLDVEIPSDFFEQLQENFEVEETTEKSPSAPAEMMMYLAGSWYNLKVKENNIPTDPVGKLDVSLLQNLLIAPIFDIQDVRSDKRIDFVGGIHGPQKLEELVDSQNGTVAFSMYPTKMRDLLQVADAKEIMPPKSTWFEPKLLSGLFLHDLETK